MSVVFRLYDAGGLKFVHAQWVNSRGSRLDYCPSNSLNRVSGDAMNATYSVSCTLPVSGIANGLYPVAISAQDMVGNSFYRDIGTFNVTGGIDDEIAPALEHSLISPKLVSPGGTVSVVFRLYDAGAGRCHEEASGSDELHTP